MFINMRYSKIIKHIIVCVLSIFFILSVTSCQSKYPKLSKNKPVSITIWHHYLGEQKTVFDSLVEEFNTSIGAQKGITVKAYSMDSTGDIHKKLISAAKNEPGSSSFPDMATAYPSTAYALYKMDKLISIEKYMSKNELNKYIDSFIEEGKVTKDSGLVIFPMAKSTEALYINYTFYKNFLDDYNARNPANPLSEDMLSTFDGIHSTAKAYYEWTDAKTPDKPNDGQALFGFDAASNFAVIGFHQLGTDFFSTASNTGTIDLSSPSMKTIWNEYFIPMVKGYYGAYSQYRSEDVQTGNLVMFAGSSAGASFFPKTVTFTDNTKYDVELKVLPYPTLKGGKKAAVQQGAGVIVAKSSLEKEYASTVFLKWITEPERNVRFVLKTGYLPVTKEALDKTMPEELSKIAENPGNTNVSKVITSTLDMIKNYELYTYKPFDHSDDMRYAFEDKLLADTTSARESFIAGLSNGKSFETCVNDVSAENLFEQFLAEVQNEILKSK